MNLNKIKEIAKSKRIPLIEIANQVGFTNQGLRFAIERKTMKADSLEKIANILQVPIWIFFDVDPESSLVAKIKELENENEEIRKSYSVTIQGKFECERYIDTLNKIIASLSKENEALSKQIEANEKIKALEIELEKTTKELNEKKRTK